MILLARLKRQRPLLETPRHDECGLVDRGTYRYDSSTELGAREISWRISGLTTVETIK
jgi:hypothetical protein